MSITLIYFFLKPGIRWKYIIKITHNKNNCAIPLKIITNHHSIAPKRTVVRRLSLHQKTDEKWNSL